MRALLAVGRLLLTAEEAGPDFSGTLVVQRRADSVAIGKIFFQEGRLRWASAPGFTTRLVPLLAEAAGVAVDEVALRLRRSAELGESAEESLLQIEGLDEALVRRALLRHISAVVAFLAGQAAAPEGRLLAPFAIPFAGPPGRFSFSTLEVLGEIFGSSPEISASLPALPRVFTDCGPALHSAFCFLEVSEPFLPALPVAACGGEGGALLSALDLLRQALRFRAGMQSGPKPASSFAGLIKAGDRGWAVTYDSPYVCVFRLSAPGESGRIFSRYRQERRERSAAASTL